MRRPPPGSQVWWRTKGALEWRYGYCAYVSGHDMIRLGPWNGCNWQGPVVYCNEIEWKPR